MCLLKICMLTEVRRTLKTVNREEVERMEDKGWKNPTLFVLAGISFVFVVLKLVEIL
jgi:hypothetical protein